MYFILAFGVFTLAVIAERVSSLYYKLKEAPRNLRQQLLVAITKGDLAGAATMSQAYADTSLGRIANVGCTIRANAGSEEELQARMDEQLSAEISSVDRRTGFLAMFGNVATLLGLLGTITGMIHSFAAVASASPADRATMLSKGIAEAMNCTAFGLIVAIPALVAYAVMQNRTDRLVTALTEATSQIYHDLLFLTSNETATTAPTRRADARSSAGNGVQSALSN